MKACPRCKKEFTIEEYGVRKKEGKIVPQVYCPRCTKAYRREHYQENKEPYKQRAIKTRPLRIKKARNFIINYLLNHPCVDCGNSDIRVLQFDHVQGDKHYNVGNCLEHSTEGIQREIDKCEVRCGNCHKIKTDERAGVWWTKPEFGVFVKGI